MKGALCTAGLATVCAQLTEISQFIFGLLFWPSGGAVACSIPAGQAMPGGPLGALLAVLLGWGDPAPAVHTWRTRAFALTGVVQGLVALWVRLTPA